VSTNRRVAPSRAFARKLLARWSNPSDHVAAQYSHITDEARKAFPEPTEFHLAFGFDWHQIVHPWPEQKVIIVVDAQLMEDGTVTMVDFQTMDLPDSPADLGSE